MFDLSISKILILAVIAIVIFGPDQLPRVASQAGRALRELRRMAEGAKEDLRAGLGPEFSEFDFNDLNPRQFVRKHLIDPVETELTAVTTLPSDPDPLAPGQHPPFDPDVT